MNDRGCYRRRTLVRLYGKEVEAGVEDDFHHFRVRLVHDGTTVTATAGESIRFPWVTCPGASKMLDRLIGTALRRSAMRHADAFDRFQQCTHQLELTLIAIAAAARGQSRCYDVTITDPDESHLQHVTVCVDGVPMEEWTLRADTIVSPVELVGRNVRELRPWVDALDDERYERIAVLRRCLQVGAGRLKTILPDVASEVFGARNACYAFQDERAASGYFVRDSKRDHSDGTYTLLEEFR